MERRSGSPGELASAEWVAGRLRELGAEDVRVERFRGPHTYAWAFAIHFAAGLLGAARGGRLGAALAAVALASFEAEYSGRSQWLRRFLPAGEGANVVARLPARGEARRTLVLVAHHDAAHTGLAWHPALTRAGDAAAERTGKHPSLALPTEAALALAAVGAATGSRAARRVAAGALAAALAFLVDVARGQTVPGANDNATGVAAMLALAGRLAETRDPGTEVIVLAPGCEESGMAGMAAWLARAGPELHPARTLVLGLDTMGSGTNMVIEAEGGQLWPARYREEDLALADAVGLPRFRLGAWTDPILAVFAGLPTLSLVSIRDGGIPNYHRMSDTAANVDWDCLEAAVELAHAVVAQWGREVPRAGV